MAAPPSRLLPVALVIALLLSPPLGMVALWTAVKAERADPSELPGLRQGGWRWVAGAIAVLLLQAAGFGLLEAASWARNLWMTRP